MSRLVLAVSLSFSYACTSAPPDIRLQGDGGTEAPSDGGVSLDDAGTVDAGGSYIIEQVPAFPQRDGDPEAGYRALVNESYVGCGLPAHANLRHVAPRPFERGAHLRGRAQ